MAARAFDVEFRGYWRDRDRGGIPDQSGVYCVYECRYHPKNDTVTIHKLIYIGEAADVRDRISNHEKRGDWQAHVGAGNELCYSFGAVSWDRRQRVEAAYVFHHEPPENTEYVDTFPFDRTRIRSSGKHAKLDPDFTVERTD